MPCICEQCSHLYVWPEMPYMDPPQPGGAPGEWSVACNWLGPLIDGAATLVRRAFPTDAGSIPQAAQSIVGHPFQMPVLPAFLCHDAEYAAELHRRAVCDARLYKFTRLLDVTEIKRRVIFRAVRLGGGSAWRRHSPGSIGRARELCRSVGEEEWHALALARTLARGGGF